MREREEEEKAEVSLIINTGFHMAKIQNQPGDAMFCFTSEATMVSLDQKL